MARNISTRLVGVSCSFISRLYATGSLSEALRNINSSGIWKRSWIPQPQSVGSSFILSRFSTSSIITSSSNSNARPNLAVMDQATEEKVSSSSGAEAEVAECGASSVNSVEVSKLTEQNEATSTQSIDIKPIPEAQKSEESAEDVVSQSEAKGDVSSQNQEQKHSRKKKTVLMLSYCGQGYLGMQKNPGMKTIEDDLLQSLLKAGYIDEEAYKLPRSIQFQRAARTDKHVSAARQIVSMRLPDPLDLEKINQFLPPEIRVMGSKKVTKGFDCKQNCDARTYMYMIPTFAFVPIDQNVTEDYRITPKVLEEIREALKLYLGTKNFHNFTSRRKPTDPSSKRYIISFTASDPFEKDGLEYLILRVKGQSFMLHQIRKMIGLVVAYLRGFAGKDTFLKTWTLDRIDIPKAPGVGLVLDHVHYERYNQRYGSDGMHSPLTWDDVSEKVENFCQDFIYPVITKCENEEKSMFEWLVTLPYHTYDVRDPKANPADPTLSRIGNAAYHIDKALVKDEDDDSEAGSDDDEGVPRKRQKKVWNKSDS